MSANCAATEEGGKGKLTLEEFTHKLEDSYWGYEPNLGSELNDLRDEYDIVDEDGNIINHKIDFLTGFDTSAEVSVEYTGDIESKEESSVKELKRAVNKFWRVVENFWEVVEAGKCKQRNCYVDAPYEEAEVNSNSFGNQLAVVISNYNTAVQDAKRAFTCVDSSEHLSEEEKKDFKRQILETNNLLSEIRGRQ